MTLSERHRELCRKKKELADKMAAVVKQEEDGEIDSDAANGQFEELSAALAALDARITRVEAAMAAEAALATSDIGGNGDGGNSDDDDDERRYQGRRFDGQRVPARAKRDPDKGLKEKRGAKAARWVYALTWARFHHRSLDEAATFVSTRFGDDDVAKAIKALNSSITGEGGALIPQDFLADLIELLRSTVVVRAAGPMEVGMPMGNLTIPRLAGGATAAYQGELDDIQISQERFDDVNFFAKKLTALVPISNDLIRRAPIGVEEVVRDDLVQTVARREDLAFLRGDGTTKDPIGMRHLALAANIINVPAMPAVPAPGDQLTAIINMASSAILTLQNGMSRMIRPAWFMAPTVARFISQARDQIGGFYYKDEIAAGRFEGFPLYISQQLPTNLAVGTGAIGSEIYFCDMADFVIADTYNVLVDASDVAAYNDGTNIVSSFQRDQSLVRVIGEHDCNMRHLQSLVVLITQDWGFAGVPGLPGAPWSSQPLNPTWSQAGAIRPARATGANAPPPLADPT